MVNVYEIRPGSYATKAEVADAETEGGVTKEYVDAGLAEKQDVLTAGANITIVENVISATGGAEYTAGSGIAISDQNVISNTAQPDVDKAYVDAQLALKANSASLATVATSGSYEDLSNKPTIPSAQVNSDWNASSGVAEILNKPTIPSGADLVPSTTGASTGDVLTVGSSGPEWAAPGGSAPTNMVTTDTAQTISGLKTFSATDGSASNRKPALFVKSDGYGPGTYPQQGEGIWLQPVNAYTPANIALLRAGESPTQPTNLINIINASGENITNYRIVIGDTSYPVFEIVANPYTAEDTKGVLLTTRSIPQISSNSYKVVCSSWVKSLMPESTIDGDDTTTSFTINHSLGKMPGIVQVTDYNGVVMKDSEITITKTTTNVTIDFEEAPASGTQYTVAMLY